MFDTIARAGTPSPMSYGEITADRRVHQLNPYREGLVVQKIGPVSVYTTPQVSLADQAELRAGGEMQYVETEQGNFTVNASATPHVNLSRMQIMSLIWAGLGRDNATTSAELSITLATIRTHRQIAMGRLLVSSMSSAMRASFEHRVFMPVQDDSIEQLTLTPRQLDVLRQYSVSDTKEATGKALYLTTATVRTHLQEVLKRNQLRNVTQAVFRACLSGQITTS